jgi:hypothetical protein
VGLPLLFYQAETFGIVPPAEPEDGENEAIKPLPDRLVTELAAYRTDQTGVRTKTWTTKEVVHVFLRR